MSGGEVGVATLEEGVPGGDSSMSGKVRERVEERAGVMGVATREEGVAGGEVGEGDATHHGGGEGGGVRSAGCVYSCATGLYSSAGRGYGCAGKRRAGVGGQR